MKKNRLIDYAQLLKRVACCLIIMLYCTAYLAAQNSKVTINKENITVKELLSHIEKNIDYSFAYGTGIFDLNKKISVVANNKDVKEVLLSAIPNIQIQIDGKKIIILSKSTTLENNSAPFMITGTVTDVSGQAIPGTTVMIKGTTKGIVTDIDGVFSLKVQSKDVLEISFLGFISQSIKVGSQKKLGVVLKEDSYATDEVVVIGYGTTKKALVTGANLHKNREDIASLSTATAMEALQGVSPGLSISRNSGSPGAGTKVSIRGLGTIGNSNPLYIVDGVSVSNIDYLSSNDIESVDVLKDAASAAIYGSRAANGVILVTTRKGGKDRVSVSYSGYYGVQNIYKKAPALNAQEYMLIMDEGRINDGLSLTNWEATLQNNTWLNGQTEGLGTKLGDDVWEMLGNGWKGTDWVDEISSGNAPIQNHSINIAGSKEDMNYSFGFSYFDQASIIGEDIIDAGYQRITARMNTEFILLKNSSYDIVKFGENFTYTNSERKSVATDDIYFNDLHDAIVQSPLMPAYWADSPNPYGFTPSMDGIDVDQVNPIAQMFYRGNDSWGKDNSIVGNLYAEVQPIKNLIVRSSFGLNVWFGHSRTYRPAYAIGGGTGDSFDEDQVFQQMTQGTDYTWTNTVSYKHDIGDHHLEALLGQEMIKNELNINVSGIKQNTAFGSADNAYLDNAELVRTASLISGRDGAAGGGGLLSYMGRLSYNYSGKYIADVTMRADGSSNFAEGNRWGYFPSFSAGWVFSDESFLKDNNILSFGKLRASWGQNGNQNIPNFIYTSNIEYVDNGYFFGNDKVTSTTTAIPENIANPDITWETSEQLNLGLDARFFSSRLNFTFDWYKKMTKDWLVKAPIMGTSGASAPFVNGGDIKNSGVELFLGWNDQVSDFKYGVSLSGSFNKNEVTRIANEEGIITGPADILAEGASYVSRVEVGNPIGYFYGYKTDGIIQNQAEADAYVNKDGDSYFSDIRPGDIRFVDLNEDGLIDDQDKTKLGKPNPDFELGIQLNFEWKGIFLNTTLAGKYGMQVMQSYRNSIGSPEQNYTTAIFGRWHGEGTSNRLPRLSSKSNRNNSYVSDIYMHDADFLRINNLTVGYDFRNIVKNVPAIKGAKVYVTCNNLHTFTKYDGMDPDVAYGGSNSNSPYSWVSGIDLGLFPVPRTILFGIDLTF